MGVVRGGEFQSRMGSLFEGLGLPGIAGRLFGYLLVCSPPEQSAAQLSEAIGASAGSVSTMLRLLREAGFVESRGERGGRRRWHRISPGAFSRVLAVRLRLVTELKVMAEFGIQEMGPNAQGLERLEEMRACYAFFEREFPALLDRYSAEQEGES